MRAARLPLREGARLDLVHAIPVTRNLKIPPEARAAAAAALEQERADLEAQVRAAARSDVSVKVHLLSGGPAMQIEAVARKVSADIVVVGRRARPRARDVLLGSTASRILRRANVPILVVGAAAHGPYRRVAAALDVDRDAARVALLAARMPGRRPGGNPLVRIIHAYDAPFESFISGNGIPEARQRYRAGFRDDARLAIKQILDRIAPQPVSWRLVVKCGSPRAVVLATTRAAGADLLVLGSQGRGPVARLVLGSVAEDAIREATCDVLVWRPGP
jgi:nucleotide-binding universal stress UspA family protein